MKLLDFFPEGYTPRAQQKIILDKIEKACKKGKKYIVVQAPTGAGKSHIAATLANFSRDPDPKFVQLANRYDLFKRMTKESSSSVYQYDQFVKNEMESFGVAVLTCTKALQHQYDNVFDFSQILKGKRNYVCAVDDEFDCDIAPCTANSRQLEKCKSTHNCPYLVAQKDTLISKFGIYNYSVFLTLPEHLQRKQFLICDEASELEDQLVSHFSCILNYNLGRFKQLDIEKLKTDNKKEAFIWLNDVYSIIKTYYSELITSFNVSKKKSRKKSNEIALIRFYRNMLDRILMVIQNWEESDYIVEYTEDECKFTPLYVSNLSRFLFEQSDHVILMSGTIIDPEYFCQILGIKDYEYIEVNSDFDPKDSPIFLSQKFPLNYKNLNTNLPIVIDLVKKICNHYPDDKGIIHTHTMKITSELKRALKGDKRFLFRDAGFTNETILNQHVTSSNPTILVSPSLGFGTDLSDDLARFCVIIKTPYLPLNDLRIKALAKRSQRWYVMKALVILVQMCGRSTRSNKDFSDTYIVDGAAWNLIKNNNTKLPKWFVDRCK